MADRENRFYRPEDRAPEEGQYVEWLLSDGLICPGRYSKGLWFLGDDLEVYTYARVALWRPRDAD